VRRACFVTDGSRLILPAFGAFTGGLNVLDRAIAGLFSVPPLVGVLGRDRVHALPWDSLV
ncbi:MAG: phosphoesterase, partial [Brevundimonas sp.]|nr:phosphoesterase [Brevundimonas sp.]